jgi:cytochrome P450 family 135
VAVAGLPAGPRLPAPLQTALWLGRPDWPATFPERYGEPMTLRLAFGPPTVFTAEPALAHRVLTLPDEAAGGADENQVLEPLLGPRSILMRSGADHVRLRRLLAPLLRGERMHGQAAAIEELARREVARWPRGTPFPLLPRMRALTLDVIVRVVFGLGASSGVDELVRRLALLLETGTTWMVVPALRQEFPGSPWSRFLRRKREVNDALRRELAARGREDGADAVSVLGRAAAAGELTEEELVDQLVTLLVAGFETTATSLAWAFDLTLRDPALVERLRAGDGGNELLDGVVRETLRLRPIFRMVSRRLRQPLELGGRPLPAGVAVAANVLAIHRRPDLYPDPARFRPQRWVDAGPPPAGAYLPFGAGVRRCLGAAFAPFEMAIVLRTVLQAVRLRAVRPEPEPPTLHAVVMMPRHGATVVAER